MICGIIGSRDLGGVEYANYEHIKATLDMFDDISRIISGGAKGVERLVERYAKEKEIPFAIIKPDNSVSEDAMTVFSTRNIRIVDASDTLMVFWNGSYNQAVLAAMSKAVTSEREVTLLPMK